MSIEGVGCVSSAFAYFDGDNVGSRLELLLLDNDSDGAKTYSESVAAALVQACQLMRSLPTAQIIFAGGDDIFATWQMRSIQTDDIETIRAAYYATCGQTLSVGVGLTPMNASLSLRRAKLLGKSQLVFQAEMLK
jgi:hypothetical protein